MEGTQKNGLRIYETRKSARLQENYISQFIKRCSTIEIKVSMLFVDTKRQQLKILDGKANIRTDFS